VSDVDDQIARARAAMERIAGDYGPQVRVHRKRIARKATGVGKRLALIAAADAMILIAAMIAGCSSPLGIFGFLAVMMLLVAVTLAIALAPAAKPRPRRSSARPT
jgi:hypothetical protein